MTSLDVFLKKMKKAWKLFAISGEIDASVVRPIIAESWKRCKLIGLDPYSKRHLEVLNDKEIEALLKRNKIYFTANTSLAPLT